MNDFDSFETVTLIAEKSHILSGKVVRTPDIVVLLNTSTSVAWLVVALIDKLPGLS